MAPSLWNRLRRWWNRELRDLGKPRLRSAQSWRGLRFDPLEERQLLAVYAVDYTGSGNNPLADSVDATIHGGSGTALDPYHMASLRGAIIATNAAAGADTIQLPSGVYTLTINGRFENSAATGDLDITGTVTLVGASETGTIIQAGASAASGIDRVFEVLPGGNATFQTLTIQHGNAWAAGEDGGGIQANGDNFSGQNAVIALSHVTVRDNIAGRGAGINNNLATSNTTLTITDSTITGNEGHNRGGGLGVGGFGTLYLTRSTVSDNTTTENGAGIALHTATSGVITSSTISGNSADFTGGGILTFGGSNPLTIINSTISGNQAKNSSGGIHADADLTIINSTITGNNGDSDHNGSGIGGGIIIGNRTQTIYNSIIAGNFKGTTPSDIENVGDTINTAANNLIGNAATNSGINHGVNGNLVGNSGSGTINIATVLNTTLANNGGGTLTHSLVTNSPAINAGNNAWLPVDARDLDGDGNTSETLPVDQRGVGFLRVFGAAVDIGAFEVNVTPNVAPTIVTPGNATTAENVVTAINGISVSDVDSTTLSLTITASQGVVTIGTVGLTIAGNGTANITASGTLANLNTGLSGLQFAPNASYNGTAGVTIVANDGSGGVDTETISITVTEVNDPPLANNDTLAGSAEDGGVRVISFASLTANDSRGPANESGQTLTVIDVSNVVGGAAIINGTNIEFTPTTNYGGAAGFSYTLRDNGTTNGVNDFKTSTGSVSFMITAVNDAPLVSLATSTVAVNEDTLLALTGITVSDVDVGTGSVSVTLHAANGVVTAATNVAGGVTSGQIAGNGAATVTITASLAAINATLGDPNGLRYLAANNFNGSDAVTITINDLGQTGSGGALTDSDSIAITVQAVNDPPSITAVSLTPTNPLTTDTLTATPQGYFDAENDPPQYSYQWFINGATVAATTSTLPASNYRKGDTVFVRVTPSDGAASGPAVNSNSVFVKIVPSIVVTRGSGYFTGSPFIASATVTDPEDLTTVVSSPHPALSFDYYVGMNTTGQHLAGAPTAVGTYTVVANYAGTGVYTSVQSTPVTFAIAGTIVVTTSSDLVSHVGTSLRDAVATANFAASQGLSDTITFDTVAMGNPNIVLSQGLLEFTGSTGATTIDGNGLVTIHGDARINTGAAVTLTGVGIRGTWTNGGSLTLSSGNGQPFTMNGTIINTGHQLTLSGTSGFSLAGGTIQGGTVAETLGAILTSSGYGLGGGTLSGVVFNGDLSVPDSSGLVLTNGLTLNGTLAIGNTSVVYVVGSQTINGSGDVLFTGIRSALQVSTANSTLTIGSSITIHGGSFLSNGTFAGAVIGYSDFWSGGANAHIVNLGTIITDAASSFITINPTGTFSNAGTISASGGGTLNVQGNWTSSVGVSVVDASTVNLGGVWSGVNLTASGGGTINANGAWTNAANVTLQASTGSHINLSGSVDNTGHTLHLAGSGSIALSSGTIQGGTVAETLGAALTSSGYGLGGGTLSGVLFQGNLSVPDSSGLVLTNGLTLNGTLAIGNTSVVYVVGSQTINGSGDVLFTGIRSALQVSTANSTLTIGSSITIHGGSFLSNGTFAGAVIGYSDLWSGGANASIVNEGTIAADAASSFLTINPTGTFSNAGTISAANGGTLNVTTSLLTGPDVSLLPGQLVVNGDVLFGGDEMPEYEVVLRGTLPGVSYGQLQTSGSARTVTLNGARLEIELEDDFTPNVGSTFTIIDNPDSASSVAGTFFGLSQGATIEVDGIRFAIDYHGGTNSNDVVLMTVPLVNDNLPPVITKPGGQSVNEDTNLNITGISISDVDAADANVTVTLAVAHGTLTVSTNVVGGVSSGNVSGNGAATVSLTAPLAKINTTLTAVSGVVYLGTLDYNGTDALTITANDLGNTGAGGALTDTDTVAINVLPVDDFVEPSLDLAVLGSPFAENGGTAAIMARLSNVYNQSVVVQLSFGGTATLSDYSRSASLITIPAGQTSGSITLTSINDFTFEGNESVTVDVTGVINGSENGTQSVTATINDDDTQPSVSLALSGSSLTENGGTSTVRATLSNPSTQNVTVSLGFSGSATSGFDYSASSNAITILAGQTSGSITLTGINDFTFEGNESVTVDVTGVINGSENGTQSVTATITDDETQPSVSLSLSNASLAENGGTAMVRATLSNPSTQNVTVALGFAGSATLNADYSCSAVSIVISAGQTSGAISLLALNDATFEGNESIVVDISSVTNGFEQGTQSVTATIVDDDPQFIAPTLDLNGAAAGTAFAATITQAGSTIAIVNSTALTIADPDSSALISASLVLNQTPDGVNESLAVDISGTPITATYSSTTRTLSLVGNATVQQYQQVLRTATYKNLALAPNTSNRTVLVVVNDGNANSNTAVSTISFAIVTTAPVVDLDGVASANFGYAATFDRLSGPVNIAGPIATIVDTSSVYLASGTATLQSAPNGVAESLAANTTGTLISSIYNATNRTLSLTGIDTVANYQKVLRTITYNNSAASPTLGQRLVQTTVFDGALTCSFRTSTIQVQAVNYAPVVTTSAAALNYTRNTPAVVIDAALTITDADAQPSPYPQLQQAQVIISGGFVPGQDQLVYTNTAGIPGTFNATSGILTLTGFTAITNYTTALRSVKFQTASTTLGPRTITFRVLDATSAVNGALWSNAATRTINVLGPLMVADSAVVASPSAPTLTPNTLRPIVTEAIARWSSTGLSTSQIATLQKVVVDVRDLQAPRLLGLGGGNQIILDDNAAGLGWFGDASPHDDSEFSWFEPNGGRRAPGMTRVDLLSVVLHEMGHVLGLPDLDSAADDVMFESISAGVRRTAVQPDMDARFAAILGAVGDENSARSAYNADRIRAELFARWS